MTLLDSSCLQLLDQKGSLEGRAAFSLLSMKDFDLQNVTVANICAPIEKEDWKISSKTFRRTSAMVDNTQLSSDDSDWGFQLHNWLGW